MYKLILALVLFITTSTCMALSKNQETAIELAQEIGVQYNIPLVPHVVMQESSGCVDRGTDGNRSFGCMQVSLPAARDVFKYCATHDVCKDVSFNGTNQELVRKLMDDKRFNITVGTLYLKMHYDLFDGDIERALIAYNGGYQRARRAINTTQYKYVRLVKMRHLQVKHPSEKIYDDYSKYVALCKHHNQPCWNISDQRNFYRHFTYISKTFGK